MALEYSWELSTEAFASRVRLIELGYRQSGPARFVSRRMRIDRDGMAQGISDRGGQVSLQAGRLILVAGSAREVETVRRINCLSSSTACSWSRSPKHPTMRLIQRRIGQISIGGRVNSRWFRARDLNLQAHRQDQ